MARVPRTLLTATLVLLLAAVAIFGWRQPDPVSSRIAKRLAEAPDEVVDFATLADFDWDRVYFFPPYSPRSEIEKSLRRHWRSLGGSSIESKDDVTLVVFVKGNRIVRSFDHPRARGDFASAHHPEGYARSEARFMQHSDPADNWPTLRPATQPTSAPAPFTPSPLPDAPP